MSSEQSLQIQNTASMDFTPTTVMLLYGEGGVGKTTYATTAPTPIIADCEGGTKYLGLQGISVDVAPIQYWRQMRDFLEIAQSGKYETVVIDPIDELMLKLKQHMRGMRDAKLVQKDGSPTMAGWGWLKKTLRDYIKVLRDTGLHVIIVAHIEEGHDEDRMIKRPKVETKLSDELVNIVDIVGYMTVIEEDEGQRRAIMVDPSSDKYTAKDRTGQLPAVLEPDFQFILNTTGERIAEVMQQREQEEKKAAKKQKKTEEKSGVAIEGDVATPEETDEPADDETEGQQTIEDAVEEQPGAAKKSASKQRSKATASLSKAQTKSK
jgi:phage nucleotide-binding protein